MLRIFFNTCDATRCAAQAYGLPENFLEVEVTNAQTHYAGTKEQFTDYAVTVHTNLPTFKRTTSTVRRRYKDFEWLRDALEKEVPRVNMPSLPGMSSARANTR